MSTANTWSSRQTFNGGITGALTGNADTATKLATARNINGVKFDGSVDISIPTITSRGRVTALTGTTQGAATGLQMYEAYNNGYPSVYGNVLHLKGATAVGEGELFIGWSGTSGAHAPVHVRSRRDTDTASWSEWAQVYTSKDSIPGVNTTGNQNTTGNAASATKLQTARTIGGVSFNGTANIDLPGVNKTGNQSTTGNAATATKLQTARTINGVSFDGTANISLSPANIGCPASPTGWLETGDNGASITTEQLVTLLRDNGAFNAKVWIARCAWAYANSASIPDSETGCGIIPLAGAVIEVFSNNTNNYTIRITTATTTSVSGALTNAEFIYVSNGTSYSPGWRRAYNTKNKPTAADVGALPLSGGALTGGLTAAGEIISKSANGLRIAYGNYGFFIRNDGSNTYFMLTDSGNSLGTYNRLRPLIINNANGTVTIGNGLNVTGGINGSLNGNASTATKLQTARKISGVSFDGSADITLTAENVSAFARRATGTYDDTSGAVPWNAESGAYNVTRSGASYIVANFYTGVGSCRTLQIRAHYKNGGLYYRSSRDGYGFEEDWTQIYTKKDSIPGVNTTGNQNTTGNAATATKLQTARTIGGVSFDGSANIDLPGVNKTGNQNTTGNAATATKLQTACTINGVSFDGSKDIELNPRSIGTINSTTMSFSGGAGWFKLATVTMPQASSVVYISLIGGAGFNVGSPQQAGISELVLRAGNGNPKGITGALWRRTSVGFTNFAWVNTSGDTYDVYVEIGNYATGVNIQWDYTSNASVTIHTSPTYTANKPTGLTDGTVYVIYSSHIKPTAAEVGALSLSGGQLNGALGIGTSSALGGNSIVLGDNDTGFKQNGDGYLDVYANNVHVMRFVSGSIQSNKTINITGRVNPSDYGNFDSRYVKDVRLGTRVVQLMARGGRYEKAGHAITGLRIIGEVDGDDEAIFRPIQKYINGTWYNVAQV
ncbi:Phage tail fiber protein [Shigella dysenteriae CDC 74-1112]|nr:Phage tail fiber protein [Shigella dysenteriae CDC 74-1112]